jgi:ATP-dependent NAD(P)H-hydrate dehydratase
MQAYAKLGVRLAREQDMYMVIDADGLFMVEKSPDVIQGYKKVVLTPNVVEFKRLCEAQVGRASSFDYSDVTNAPLSIRGNQT